MSVEFVVNPGLTAAVRRAARSAVDAGAGVFSADVKRLLSRSGRSAPGSPPGLRSGRLRDGVRVGEATESADRVGRSVASTAPHAAIHERGGTIRAKGRLLTVPLNPDAEAIRERYASLEQAPGLHIRKTRKGVLLVDDDGRPMFALKEQVVMPRRPYLAAAQNSHHTRERVLKAEASAFARAIGGGR